MVFVKVSETYDLSTKVNKMGFIGIHTPKGELITRMWSGLVANHKFIKFVKCDVDIACASILPADPLQVGVEAGQIAPQDLFNPILYTAVSNDSMSNILGRIYYLGSVKSALTENTLQGDSVDANNNLDFKQDTASLDQFKIYYSQLANTSGWRKAMPQQGLSMHGLFPICYNVITNYGMNGQLTNSGGVSNIPVPAMNQDEAVNTIPIAGSSYIKGSPCRMPRFPTTQFVSPADADAKLVGSDGVASGFLNYLPPVYVGAIIMPPAKLSRLYYRLKVTWTIEFSEPRPSTDILNWSTLNYVGGDLAYSSDYVDQTKTASNASEFVSTESVDTSDMDIEKVMESA